MSSQSFLAGTSMDEIETEEEFLEAYPEGYDLVFSAYTESIKKWGVAHPSRYFPKVKGLGAWPKKYKQIQDMEEFLGFMLIYPDGDPEYTLQELKKAKTPREN